jgi:hypothetical protein
MKTALPKSVIFCVAVVLIGIAATPRATAAPSDFDGVWIPDVKDQHRQETENVPPWKPEVVPQIQRLIAEEKAGRPFLVLSHCLPHGMPSWMLMTHNAFEWLTTPGRVTMLGEVDGNRMRRIYTDGRPHPEDPDPTLHGHSIGHWEGDVLVVDTTAIAPQAYIAPSEAVGIPNNGDMHIVERLYLAKPNELRDDLEITAPKVLAARGKPPAFSAAIPIATTRSSKANASRKILSPARTNTATTFSSRIRSGPTARSARRNKHNEIRMK